ncbi:hypothetical protein ACUNV4_24485 [Granulosicoccus sp. 3-233]|uniref:hypothetical protein n=1 Tax=Granulosicoccus sp. 3-233 TaxID=3417969 RepID=UPI003D3573DB
MLLLNDIGRRFHAALSAQFDKQKISNPIDENRMKSSDSTVGTRPAQCGSFAMNIFHSRKQHVFTIGPEHDERRGRARLPVSTAAIVESAMNRFLCNRYLLFQKKESSR